MVHMKVQNAPTSWRVKRKGAKFLLKPNPGKSYELSMPISLILKNVLKYCKTTKEVKSILQENEVIVDGKRRKDHRYPVGVMDVITFKATGESFRVVLNDKGKIDLVGIDSKEASLKPSKIVGKTVLGKDRIQLNLFDSTNLIVKSGDYKVGDTIVLKFPKLEVKETLKVDKGSLVFLSSGKNRGKIGVIEEMDGDEIRMKDGEGNLIITKRGYAFAIGTDSPVVKIKND